MEGLPDLSTEIRNDEKDDCSLWERNLKDRRFLVLVMMLASPIIFLFAYCDEGERGFAAWGCAVIILYACRNKKERMHARWFWITILVLAVAQVPIIVFVPWKQTGGAFPLILCTLLAFDTLIIRSCIWLVERQVNSASGAPFPD
jgi:hypothetical protein